MSSTRSVGGMGQASQRGGGVAGSVRAAPPPQLLAPAVVSNKHTAVTSPKQVDSDSDYDDDHTPTTPQDTAYSPGCFVRGIIWINSVGAWILALPFVTRCYFFVFAVLDIADCVSDALWLRSIVHIYTQSCTEEYQHDACRASNDQYSYVLTLDEYRWIQYLCGFTIFFFVLSMIMLLSKFYNNYSDLHKDPYLKLNIFVLALFYLLTESSANIKAYNIAIQQAKQHEDANNIVDGIVGIVDDENYLDRYYPHLNGFIIPAPRGANSNNRQQANTTSERLARVEANDQEVVPSPPTPATRVDKNPLQYWQLIYYPLLLTCRPAYWRSMWCVGILTWPVSFLVSALGFVFALPPIAFVNMLVYSDHSNTIRLFEDIPQLTINILFQLSSFNRHLNGINYYSLGSLSISALMLFMGVVGMFVDAVTGPKVKVSRRRVRIRAKMHMRHVLYITWISPLIMALISFPLSVFYIIWGVIKILLIPCCGLVELTTMHKIRPAQ